MWAALPVFEALGLGLVRYELGWMTDSSIVALRMSGGNLQGDILLLAGDVSSESSHVTKEGDASSLMDMLASQAAVLTVAPEREQSVDPRLGVAFQVRLGSAQV